MNTINFYPTKLDQEHQLTEQIVFTDETNLEDLKGNSKYDCIQLFSFQLGNGSHYKIFLGTYNEFTDYLTEDCKEDLEGGYIHFNDNMINLNITTLKAFLKKGSN